MTALRVYPFIGAALAVAAVVLAIIGVSTTYWFSTDSVIHSGRSFVVISSKKKYSFLIGIWQNCAKEGCVSTNGGRPGALAITVRMKQSIDLFDFVI